jgi:2-methylisocitrate lyase-like PEP mutase family enzyme
MSSFKKFEALHHGSELFVLANAWDARSAILIEKNGFHAIGTSSAAVANSLGYEDGENMPLIDYLFVIRRILSSITVPLTVDIETGYGGTPDEVAGNILKLAELGVAGINIEDSVITGGHRSLANVEAFAEKITHIKQKLRANGHDVFINLRCDTYILNVDNKQQETARRLKIYNNSGADGIFLPCITEEKDIAEVVSYSKLPLNVMAIPGLPNLQRLNNLGVKRVSMGPFMFQKVYGRINELTKAIHTQGSLAPILS